MNRSAVHIGWVKFRGLIFSIVGRQDDCFRRPRSFLLSGQEGLVVMDAKFAGAQSRRTILCLCVTTAVKGFIKHAFSFRVLELCPS